MDPHAPRERPALAQVNGDGVPQPGLRRQLLEANFELELQLLVPKARPFGPHGDDAEQRSVHDVPVRAGADERRAGIYRGFGAFDPI